MKIKVTKEGRDGVFIPETASLVEWVKAQKFEQIHNFIATGFAVVGADHEVASVVQDIESADRLAILTGDAKKNNMNHALAIIKNEKLNMYDLGEITVDMLEVA